MGRARIVATSLLMFAVVLSFTARVRGAKPASKPTSAALTGSGYFRSDRTLEDMKEAENAKAPTTGSKPAPLQTKTGTYTDPGGFVFRYSIIVPAKLEPGAKYPVFIGNTAGAMTGADSQAKWPCYMLNVFMPETLYKTTAKGFEAPKDYKSVHAAAFKAVIDKVLAEEPAMDGSRIYIEGASAAGARALIAAYNYPDTFAAAVPSVGGCDRYKAVAIARRKIGLWFFYGILDGGEPDFTKPVHNRTGPGLYKAITEAGYEARLTVYTHGDHHEYGFSDSLKNPEWNDFTRLREWLFAQKKPAMDWPVINSPSAVGATVGKPFTYAIKADKPAKSFGAVITIEHAEDVDGKIITKPESDLPKGLSFDAKTGVISGAPTEAGRFFIRLTAAGDKGEGITTLLLVIKGDSK